MNAESAVPSDILFVVSECPVCPGFGCIIALRSSVTKKMVYFAPCCGCVWSKVPSDDDPPEALDLGDINASVVELPTLAELLQAEPTAVVIRTERLSSWRDDIPLTD